MQNRRKCERLSVATSSRREKGKERIISQVSLPRHVNVRSPKYEYMPLAQQRLAYGDGVYERSRKEASSKERLLAFRCFCHHTCACLRALHDATICRKGYWPIESLLWLINVMLHTPCSRALTFRSSDRWRLWSRSLMKIEDTTCSLSIRIALLFITAAIVLRTIEEFVEEKRSEKPSRGLDWGSL